MMQELNRESYTYMPPKAKTCPNKRVKAHGTEGKQQTITEPYKHVKAYKQLKHINDETSDKLKQILETNCWNLNHLFSKELPEFLADMCNDGAVAWNNGIQYLDYPPNVLATEVKINEVSLKKFKEGEYKALYRDKRTKNKTETESSYAGRIEFFTKTFDDLKEFASNDDLKWVVKHNRLLVYNILNYHNREGHVVYTVNRDMKTITRVIKLLLGDDDELRFKFSVLQTAFTDLENLSDDFNKITSEREIRTFVPYENLFEICDKKEDDYFQLVNKLRKKNKHPEYKNVQQMYETNEEDGEKHTSQMFHAHQLSLALAVNIWNYPSRTENLTMYFIDDPENIEKEKNYIHVKNQEKCMMIYNDDVKCHKPVSYYLNSGALIGLNERLCSMLKYSYKTYKREAIFLGKTEWERKKKQVSSASVRKWLSEILPNKNIGVNTFRSSFVSYYFPKWNNRQRSVMAVRMRTCMTQLMRSYLKIYTDPDTLVKVKPEPTDELKKRAKQGRTEANQVVVNDVVGNADNIGNVGNASNVGNADNHGPAQLEQVQDDDENENVNNVVKNLKDKRKASFRKWYEIEDNKNKHKQRTVNAYGARYVRELNKGIIDFSKMNKETIEKYGIKIDANGKFYI